MNDRTADRQRLEADCGRCVALCCVALGFGRSQNFPVDKQPGVPCPNLAADAYGCTIHDTLRPQGYAGCTIFDCQGAGPQTFQVVYGGDSWRNRPELAQDQFAVFHVELRLHELLGYLAELRRRPEVGPLRQEADHLWVELDGLSAGTPIEVLRIDLAELRGRVEPLLERASTRLRSGPSGDRTGSDLRGSDLSGRDLRRTGLAAASLRGAVLIAADLRGVDLARTDLLGADLRDTDLRGADLADALFTTPSQLTAARGDAATRLPPHVNRPTHWR